MADQDKSDKRAFWHTLPGTLTALAAVITAITGLMVGLHQAGFFGGAQDGNQPNEVVESTTPTDSSSRSGTGTSNQRTEGQSDRVVRATQTKGQGRVATSGGSFEFDKISGMSMGRGELTLSQFGSEVKIPLSKIVRIRFLEGSSVSIDYMDGQSEETKLHCYWNTPVTFHIGEREIYYGDCEALKVIEEIEFFHP